MKEKKQDGKKTKTKKPHKTQKNKQTTKPPQKTLKPNQNKQKNLYTKTNQKLFNSYEGLTLILKAC